LTHDCLMSGDVTCHNCAIIYQNDIDFGEIQTVDASACRGQNPTVLPSQKIDRATLAHLTSKQQQQLLNVLDQYADCFSETPGLCNAILHEIPTTADFIPKRLCAYRVPEAMKDEVNRQIRELLELGFIKKSNSPMASPIVCVRKKGQDVQISGGVRICVNFQYLNKFTVPDQIPLPNISEIVQRVGRARHISLFDATKVIINVWFRPKTDGKLHLCALTHFMNGFVVRLDCVPVDALSLRAFKECSLQLEDSLNLTLMIWQYVPRRDGMSILYISKDISRLFANQD
jgi:hypothetical protein